MIGAGPAVQGEGAWRGPGENGVEQPPERQVVTVTATSLSRCGTPAPTPAVPYLLSGQ
eukprot:CAMPEP_0182921772 /NCGR_PEP_ID=MMETSP0105_2-20130417/4355_1 /TAXON_ID=81532 ORGANISM="Acanthoeca-like sp., Strain 10tr" /NCGR_SAMPLE_ID=MMETSP0105_2 /ASSEMBLY_ACC=CAM_ASM_000205 /LENGTH=57 /DNA_ID=CAMNT_0025059319 /DNA_START=85 /DNA_END=255 /DNA_ORIENTATION=+